MNAWATTATRTSPAGGVLPPGVTEIGGIVTDMIGASGVRLVSQLPASSLFVGFSNSGTPASYEGNPLTIGIQSGFTPAILSALGGGVSLMAVRITLDDGDTGPGDFDENQNNLIINGGSVGNFSDIATVETTPAGLVELS